MNVEEVFLAMKLDAERSGATYVYRRVLPESEFDVRLEVISASGNRRLCVKAHKKRSQSALAQTRGIVSSFSQDEGLFRVELQDSRLSLLFSALVENFLTALAEAASSSDPAQVLIDRLALWQRLFEELQFDGLSMNAQRGLFAELKFLQTVLVSRLGPDESLIAWKSPQRTSKDFSHQSWAMEIKSRLKKGDSKVRISSEDQLDPAGFELFLGVVTLDPEAFGGESLPQLVQDLREQYASSETVRRRFEDQLIRVGYLDIHRDHYEEVSYVSEIMLFRVSDGFPRILREDLAPGLRNVAYDLDLSVASPYLIRADEFELRLGESHG